MTLDDFRKFIDEQNERQCTFARAIKLGEEYRELCSEVLASAGDQRKDKLTEHDWRSLEDEFADVLVTTFLLAKSMKADMMAALGHKVQKIRDKHNKQL